MEKPTLKYTELNSTKYTIASLANQNNQYHNILIYN